MTVQKRNWDGGGQKAETLTVQPLRLAEMVLKNWTPCHGVIGARGTSKRLAPL